MRSFRIGASLLLVFAGNSIGQSFSPVPLRSPNASISNPEFGFAVACEGDVALVGEPRATVNGKLLQGTAHIFRWDGNSWVREATLVADDGASNDFFGTSVALEGDTAIVGAPGDTVAGNGAQGSACVFKRSGTGWLQQGKLVASDGASGDGFGGSVALSGESVLVGANLKTIVGNSGQGAAYVFLRNGSTWSEQSRLTAGDGTLNDYFGYSVALRNNTAVVGAIWDDVGSNVDQGSAYVFVRRGTAWTMTSKIVAPDGAAGDSFGTAVGTNGIMIACGAPFFNAHAPNNGAAYIYLPDGAGWRLDVRLTPQTLAMDAFFGASLSLRGAELLVGAPGDFVTSQGQGKAYLLSRTDGGWKQQTTFQDSISGERWASSVALSDQTAIFGARLAVVDGSQKGGALIVSKEGGTWALGEVRAVPQERQVQSYLGISVAIDGDYAVAGAHLYDGAFPDQGGVYVFGRSRAWQDRPFFPLTAIDGKGDDRFGVAVGLSGETLIAGAPLRDAGANLVDAGAGYIFARAGENWSAQSGTLVVSDAAAGDNLGTSVAVDGDFAILGAPGDDTGSTANHGAAYIFKRSGSVWSQVTKLVAPDFAANDNFGFAVDIQGDIAVVGAFTKGGQGAVYVFRREQGTFVFAQKLTPGDPAAGDNFGVSVAVRGDCIVVGAFGKSLFQGAAYIFARASGSWSQAGKLTAPDGAANDGFGRSVDVSGSNVVVGAFGNAFAGNAVAGSVYGFTSLSGSARGPWVYHAKYSPSPSAPTQYFGYSAAISGNTMVSGSSWADDRRGSLRFFDILDAEQSTVFNQSTRVGYLDLETALSAQLEGQSILAAAGAFDLLQGLTLGNVAVRSRSSIAIPFVAPVALDNGADLSAASGFPIDIYGSVQTPASGRATVRGNAVRFGGLGSVFINSGELVLNSPSAEFNGSTTVRFASSMVSNSGDISFRGPLNMPVGGSIASGENIELLGTSTLRSPSIFAGERLAFGGFTTATSFLFGAPAVQVMPWGQIIGGGTFQGSVVNSGKIILSSTTNVIGWFTNSADASVTYSSTSFNVYGRFVNNGTMTPGGNPSGCPNCLSNAGSLIVQDTLSLGETALVSGASVLEIGGGFESQLSDPLRFNLRAGTLRMNAGLGSGGSSTLEVMCRDYGVAGAAIRPFVPGGFPIGELELGPAPTVLTLVDWTDNDGSGQENREAIYLESLVVPHGSRLNTGGIRVYTRSALIEGVVDRPSDILPLPGPCDADLVIDSVVNDSDFEVFVRAYALVDCADAAMAPATHALRSGCPADLDKDGLVNDSDFTIFLSAYHSLVCP